jgi:hypothetical protein
MREPTSFSFILTQCEGIRSYGTCLIFDEIFPESLMNQLEEENIPKGKKPLFIQKSLVILSHHPFLGEFKEVLKQVYRIHLSKSEFPLERIICNFVDEIPLPDKGEIEVLYELGKPIHFQRPENFPLVSAEGIKYLFTSLSLINIVHLFEFVLVERKIYLISEHSALITYVTEAITGLIFPFMWTQMLVPILPDEMRQYIQAPVPFIIGLHGKGEELAYAALDAVKLYLDSDELISLEEIPSLPEVAVKALLKRLQPYSRLHDNAKSRLLTVDLAFEVNLIDPEEEDELFDPYDIRDAFFEFMCTILKFYPKFFKSPNEQVSVNEIFNTEEFLIMNKANKPGTFLSKLVETRVFTYFIQNRCTETQFDAEHQLLDNALLNSKKSGKDETRCIKAPKSSKTVHCHLPNTSNLPPNQTYQYSIFPRLKKELFIAPRPVENLCAALVKPLKNHAPIGELSIMDDHHWAKFLLENIYFIWFLIFDAKLKTNFKKKAYYPKITEQALFLLKDMQSQGLHINDTIFRYLIEACGYCGMTKEALELANQMHAGKPEGNPSANGLYLDALSRARANQNATMVTEEEKKEEDPTPAPVAASSLPFINFDLMMDKCPDCSRALYTEEIISGWKRSYNEYITSCPDNNCNRKFVPNFKVIEYKTFHTVKELQIQFLSPLLIKKEIENLIRLHGEPTFFNEKFAEEHSVIYWNCIMYSQLIKAPTFFFEKPQTKEYIKNAINQLVQNLGQKHTKSTTSGHGTLAQLKEYVFNSNTRESKLNQSNISKSTGKSSNSSNSSTANNANPKIKLVFSGMLAELKVTLEKKLIELDNEKIISLNKSGDSFSNVADGDDPPPIQRVMVNDEKKSPTQ